MSVEAQGRFYVDAAMKAAQWEKAKGELRALVAIQGSYSGASTGGDGEAKWQKLQSLVNKFINVIEDGGWHE